jgi:hypothetical protein
MENKRIFKGWIWTISLCICVIAASSFAGVGPAEKADFYRLVEGSNFDDCVPCMRPTLLTAVDGGFTLIPDIPEPWYAVYKVRDFNFRSTGGYNDYAGRFDGWYKIGGDFAYDHRMHLEGEINGNKVIFEGQGFPGNDLPWIEIKLNQVVPDTEMAMFALYVVATPWPGELRFSTNVDFTSANKSIGKVSNGDLLATSGRVVRRNYKLTRRLGIMPIVPDLGLDAVAPPVYLPTAVIGPNSGAIGEPMPACEIWFSIEQEIWSEKLGTLLHDGDVLSDSGRVVRSYADLIGAFGPMPPATDVGLDALATNAKGQILFSTKQDFFSEKLGKWIRGGDLLIETGQVFKTNADLLANFAPVDAAVKDVGLDAVLLLGRDEIWFSTEIDFTDKTLGPISDGDLLSTKGRIVMKNLHLLREFAPLEKLTNFGLDAVEFASRSPLGDYNDDCAVRLDDFAELAARWLDADCVECGGIDLTGNGAVGLDDLLIFADHWLMGVDRPELAYTIGPCGGAPFPNTDPRFSVKVKGQFVYFSDIFGANCCAKGTALTMQFDGQTIRLDEIEYPGAPCDCFCPYPVSAVMGPFAPGTYKLAVWETTEGFSRLVGTVEVVIGPTMQYTVLPCGSAVPPDPSNDPRFAVQVQGQYIQFKDAIVGNCCDDKIELSMDVQGNEITVLETEYAERTCRCMCTYPTTARLGPFEPGTYVLAVVQQDFNGKRLIGTVKVVIE